MPEYQQIRGQARSYDRFKSIISRRHDMNSFFFACFTSLR
jgi:hypothetical protein